MFTIDIRANTADVIALLAQRRDQVPYATALALTRTAQAVKRAELATMSQVFDRPTPYTMNSLFLKAARKEDLTAVVWLKDDRAGSGTPADKYLTPQIRGGKRLEKRFEYALRVLQVLPSGYVAVPGAAAKLDAYGNMSVGQIRQILSYFNAAQLTSGYSGNMTTRTRERLRRGTKKQPGGFVYFVGKPGGGRLPLGVWQRFEVASGSFLKPVLMFVSSATYRPRFPFDDVAQRTVDAVFPVEFEQAATQALASAR